MFEHSNKNIDWEAYYQKEADVIKFDTEGNTHAAKRNQFAISLFPKDAKTVLDVGCGNGYLLTTLSRNKKFERLVGVDVSKPRIESIDNASVKFEVASTTNLPFEDSEFDLVSSIEVLEHIRDIESAVREMARVSSKYIFALVPGYQSIPETLCPCCLETFPGAGHLHSFTAKALSTFFQSQGLRVLSLSEYQHFVAIDSMPLMRGLSVETRQKIISLLQFFKVIERRKGYYLGILAIKN